MSTPERRDTSSPSTEVTEAEASEYTVHFGLPYHNRLPAYRFPASQSEVTRLDKVHQVLRSAGPFRGSVDEILNDKSRFRRLLNVGCGTGAWLIEMAGRYPHVDCVGIDFLEYQHETTRRNVTFMQMNVPRDMHVFASRSFDVVHVRSMIYAIPEYGRMLSEAYRLLRPGGLLIVHEPNMQCYSSWEGYTATQLAPALVEWSRAFRHTLSSRGIDLRVFDLMERLLAIAGFKMADIEASFHYTPMCPGDESEESRLQTECTRDLVAVSRLGILEADILSLDEFEELEADVTRELEGHGSGVVPDGPRGILSPWGFWWVRK